MFSRENGEAWAIVREPEGYEVTHVRGSEWVRMVRVRGLNACGGALAHAWVRRADLEVEPAGS